MAYLLILLAIPIVMVVLWWFAHGADRTDQTTSAQVVRAQITQRLASGEISEYEYYLWKVAIDENFYLGRPLRGARYLVRDFIRLLKSLGSQ
jgi:hypothetical protein